MDPSDLYDGLKLPKKTKREREEETEQKKKTDLLTIQNAPVKRSKKTLDLSAMLAKLEGYMLVDAKSAKASALFCQLMLDQLTARTSEHFLKTLTKVINEKGETLSGRKEFQTLIETLDAERDTLLSTSDEERQERKRTLDTWKFLAITHAQLFTDETYQFNKAAKVVKLRFEEIVSKEKRPQRRGASTTAAYRVDASTAHTLQQIGCRVGYYNKVDSWTKGMQEHRRAPAIARSAGSDARRNIVTASGSKTLEAGAKIPGRYNHPLFNKEI
ncbi:unnamed protein product [Peronospora destructor]|uniref:Uncharacterized protein n=1 Tax=Peronospora destructor TaxID=86335 RepID=A0AAV0SYK1_9STRA|nr:unnamed protein product [Peronospora destructor]